MEIKAKAKYIKISPRKVRLVLDLVRGMEVNQALDQLKFINKRAAGVVIKLLNSAVANAENNFDLDKDNLLIKAVSGGEGPTLHRWMPRARGRATPIRKRTTHIDLVLEEIKPSGATGPKKQKIEAPVKLGTKPKEDEGVKIKEDKNKAKSEKDKDEKGNPIHDPRSEGKGKHTKIEGKNEKSFASKMFRRKSG